MSSLSYEKWMRENVVPPVRGQCRHYSEMMVKVFSELRLARGWYIDPFCFSHQHWWCVTPSGIIIDPTVDQFMLGGTYREYDGPEPTGRCLNCGAMIFVMGNFCTDGCRNHYMNSLGVKNVQKEKG